MEYTATRNTEVALAFIIFMPGKFSCALRANARHSLITLFRLYNYALGQIALGSIYEYDARPITQS